MQLNLTEAIIHNLGAEASRRNKSLIADEPPHTVESIALGLLSAAGESYAHTIKIAQREALIPVTDEILAASAEKQETAIAAALREVRK
jgi:hypothetical protein